MKSIDKDFLKNKSISIVSIVFFVFTLTGLPKKGHSQTFTSAKYTKGTQLLDRLNERIPFSNKLNDQQVVELVDNLAFLLMYYDPQIVAADYSPTTDTEITFPLGPSNITEVYSRQKVVKKETESNSQIFKQRFISEILIHGFNKPFFELCFDIIDKTYFWEDDSKYLLSCLNHLISQVNPNIASTLTNELQIPVYNDATPRKCGFQAQLFSMKSGSRLYNRKGLYNLRSSKHIDASKIINRYQAFSQYSLASLYTISTQQRELLARSPFSNILKEYRSKDLECLFKNWEIEHKPFDPSYCPECRDAPWFKEERVRKMLEKQNQSRNITSEKITSKGLVKTSLPKGDNAEGVAPITTGRFSSITEDRIKVQNHVVSSKKRPFTGYDENYTYNYKVLIVNDFGFGKHDYDLNGLKELKTLLRDGAIVAQGIDQSYNSLKIYKLEPVGNNCTNCDERRIGILLSDKRYNKLLETANWLEVQSGNVNYQIEATASSIEAMRERNFLSQKESDFQLSINRKCVETDSRGITRDETDLIIAGNDYHKIKFNNIKTFSQVGEQQLQRLRNDVETTLAASDNINSYLSNIPGNLEYPSITKARDKSFYHFASFSKQSYKPEAETYPSPAAELYSSFIETFNRLTELTNALIQAKDSNEEVRATTNTNNKTLDQITYEINNTYPRLEEINRKIFINYNVSNFNLGIKFPENINIKTKGISKRPLLLIFSQGNIIPTAPSPCTDGIVRPTATKKYFVKFVDLLHKELIALGGAPAIKPILKNEFENDFDFIQRQFKVNQEWCYDQNDPDQVSLNNKLIGLMENFSKLKDLKRDAIFREFSNRVSKRQTLLNNINQTIQSDNFNVDDLIKQAAKLNESQFGYQLIIENDPKLRDAVSSYETLLQNIKLSYTNVALAIFKLYTGRSRALVNESYKFTQNKNFWNFDDGKTGYESCQYHLSNIRSKWVELKYIKDNSQLEGDEIKGFQKQVDGIVEYIEEEDKNFPKYDRLKEENHLVGAVHESKLYLTKELQNILDEVAPIYYEIANKYQLSNTVRITSLSFEHGGSLTFGNNKRHTLHKLGKSADFIPISISGKSIPKNEEEINANAELVNYLIQNKSIKKVYFKNLKVKSKVEKLLLGSFPEESDKKKLNDYMKKLVQQDDHEDHFHIELF
ncbi:hypothetical protein ACW9KT_08675 [Hymenobacter sp. HD11105]